MNGAPVACPRLRRIALVSICWLTLAPGLSGPAGAERAGSVLDRDSGAVAAPDTIPVGGQVASSPPAQDALPPRRVHLAFLPALHSGEGVAAVRFSVGRGVYDTPFAVALATDTPGATILFTGDGTVPSAEHGLVYEGPIPIVGTTILRAAAFLPGRRPSPVATHTYIFPADVIRQSDATAHARGLPNNWGKFVDWTGRLEAVTPDYAMDEDVVAAYDATIRDDLRALPSLSLVAQVADLFGQSGIYTNPMEEGWERRVSAEYIRTDGQPGFHVDCGLRIAGGYSRRPDVTAKHSFSLRFRRDYGPPRLHYRLFPDSPVTSFDVLRLRASQADSFYFYADKGQYLHDQWGRDTQRAMGWPSARGGFVHLYVNGLYWGLYNLTEEPTAAFAADHLGGAEADWDVIKDGDPVDGIWVPEVEDGRMDEFEAMVALVRERPEPDPDLPVDRIRYLRLAGYLDLTQHADYTLLQIFGGNTDWPEKNWRAARNRVTGDRFRFFVWDFEHTTALHDDQPRGFCVERDKDPVTGECGFIADTAGVAGLHGWLKRFPEYRLLFADRVRRHLFDGGALSPQATGERYRRLADEIERAIVGESARWGTGTALSLTEKEVLRMWRDYRNRRGTGPQTQAMWREERDRVLRDFFPGRTAQVLGQLCRVGLYPPVVAPAFNRYGGTVERGFQLAMAPSADGCPDSARRGTIYYTRDGSDPRQPGSGTVGVRAQVYDGPIPLQGYSQVKARLLADTPAGPVWSALTEAVFAVPAVAVTEIMYAPPTDPDAEFLELANLEAVPVDLAGVTIGDAVTVTLPAGTVLAPGDHVVVVRDAARFQAAYPDVPYAAVYDGNLNDQGETIVVRDAAGQLLLEVTYDDEDFWPLGPDGRGWSLVPLDETAAPTGAASWRASSEVGGSPARPDPDPPPNRGGVTVSEVLANPGPNQEDAVELRNLTAAPVDLSGWYLSDDLDEPLKFRIPDGTSLPPSGFAVFYAASFGGGGGFGLGATGEEVVLASAADGRLTGFLIAAAFGAAEDGVSFGRYEAAGNLALLAQQRPTFGVDDPPSVEAFRAGAGAPNAGPRVGPVVFTEIMYHPLDGVDEFLELQNSSAAPVALYDLDQPARTWRLTNGVTYAFPPDVVLPPGGLALVVPVAPADFRSRVDVPADVPVFGPWSGKLDNAGEALAVGRPWPDPSDPDGVPVDVEWLRYDDRAPWPVAADGGGASLERVDPARPGHDPTNWTALNRNGTPGRANTALGAIYLPLVVRNR